MMSDFLSRKIFTKLAIVFFLLQNGGFVMADDPHQILKNQSTATCSQCHKNPIELIATQLIDTKNNHFESAAFIQDGTEMCTSCHDANQGHKVGLLIDFPVPADMPLSGDSDIICLTCHYTHGSLKSDRPQASFSIMDRLFDSQRLHKSFLLRRNNSDGELCLTCHNVTKGSQK